MNILIVSSKPAFSRRIAHAACTKWRTADIRFIHVLHPSGPVFDYPSKRPLKEYPKLSKPRYRVKDWTSPAWEPMVKGTPDLLEWDRSRQIPGGRKSVQELLKSADRIVYAAGPGRMGVMAFDRLMHDTFGDDRALQCPAVTLDRTTIESLDEDDIEKAFRDMKPFGAVFKAQLQFGQVKHYFDWNWNINSHAVLGEAQRRANVPNGFEMKEPAPLTKYSLQLLYRMRKEGSLELPDMWELMRNWPGTGLYDYTRGVPRSGLGGLYSKWSIMEHLVNARLLDRVSSKHPMEMEISALGYAFLDQLHPDCQTPDLPFRLDTWGAQGMSSKLAMDAYITVFFAKQLEFMKNRPAAPAPTQASPYRDAKGSLVYEVSLDDGTGSGQTIAFKQHSSHRYTVEGLPGLNDGVLSIERRTTQDEVRMQQNLFVVRKLQAHEQWLAYRLNRMWCSSPLAVGSTPEEVYEAACVDLAKDAAE